jgi:hypothetical protein
MLIVSFTRKMGVLLSVFLVFSICILSSAPAYAQISGATLSGTVTDASGAAIPDAQVTVTNTATGITRSLPTSGAGYYNAPNLNSGSYSISVSAPGFATQERTGITLTVGSQAVLDVTMQVGTVTQSVQVTGDALAVQLASSSVSTEVNATTVRELPLNGRSWSDLALLQPGVNSLATQQPSFAVGADRGNRGFGSQTSISGGRPQQNNYRLDGLSINDYSNGAPGSVLGGNLGVDAIQEFSVLTSNYGAEYGKSSGGVINAITRSGTNTFRGSVYEFLRNSALDARNTFDPAVIPPFRQNQFGVSGGGRLIKDRTFIFGDYEGVRQSKGLAVVNSVPSLAMRQGILNISTAPGQPALSNYPRCTFTGTGTAGTIPYSTCQIDMSAAITLPAVSYLALYPLPTSEPGGLGNTALSTFTAQRVVGENFFTTRMDHKFTEKDSIYGTYVFDKTRYNNPDSMNNVMLNDLTFRQIIILEETHIFNPNVINTLRVGFNRNYVDNNLSAKALNPAAANLTLGTVPTQYASQLTITGLSPNTGGLFGAPTYFYRYNSYQASDDAFITRGTHSLKFGFVVERMQLNNQVFSNPTGAWSFPDLYSFLANAPSKLNSALGSSIRDRAYRQTLFGAYLQDDWRLRPNLTVNLGLRWEMTTILTETKGRLTNLINLTDAVAHTGDPMYKNPTLRNFEPRVGFAWDPFKNGKTAVRGGVGMFDVLPLPSTFYVLNNVAAPFFLSATNSNAAQLAGTFYQGGYALLRDPTALRTFHFDYAPHRSYVMQWNMNIQRAITPTVTATVGYVGSRGIHLPAVINDADMVLPTKTDAGWLWPCGPTTVTTPVSSTVVQCQPGFKPTGTLPLGTKTTTLNPAFGSMRATFMQAQSYYNALQVQVSKTMSHGLQVQGAFTWAKSMDTNSSTMAGDQFSNSIAALDYFDQTTSRALSDFNVGRTAVITAIWEAPGLKSSSAIANWLTGGWQIGGIFKAGDGSPITPTIGSDGDMLGKRSGNTTDYPNRLGGSGCDSLINSRNTSNYIKTQCFAIPTAPDQTFWNAHCATHEKLGTGLQCFNLRGNSGRNIINGPGITDFDFSLFKNNRVPKISENFNVQFRAELFNVLNHANYAPPTTASTDVFTASGGTPSAVGLLNSTSTTSREIQFAIKVTF